MTGDHKNARGFSDLLMMQHLQIIFCMPCTAVLMWETDIPATTELIFTGEAEVSKLCNSVGRQ